MAKSEHEYIRLEALSLAPEETSYRSNCPYCDSRGHSGSFSITRVSTGILYNCFRDKCGAHGFIPINNGSLDYPTEEKGFEPKYYNYPLSKLPVHMLKVFTQGYGLSEAEVTKAGFRWAPEHSRVYMPVRNGAGAELGCQLRAYHTDGPKTLNYKWVDEEFVHWPKINPVVAPGRPLVVVEDIVSAIRCARFGPSLALLGTSLKPGVVRFLRTRFDNVVVALDPDAYHKAMKMWKDYALFFKSFEPVKLPADPKDMTHKDLVLRLGG